MYAVAQSILDVVNQQTFRKKLEENIKFISSNLNFELQKRKMIEILGWDKDVIDEMEKNYIKFLALNKTLQEFGIDFKIIPNRYIDEFWHAHILDTKKYMEDCKTIFGQYLHHFPYYGMRNEEDKQNWMENAQLCQTIWEAVFGEKLYGNLSEDKDGYELDREFYGKLSKMFKTAKELWAMKCSRCRTCRPVNCP